MVKKGGNKKKVDEEKYIVSNSLQKREVKLKQLKKEEQSGNVPSIKKVSSQQNKEKGSEKR